MSEFTREQIKEKEPAPSANCTSPNNNNSSNYDDTSCCRICQEQLAKKIELVMQTLSPQVFEDVEEYQISIPMLSAIIGEAYGMLKMLEIELKRTGDSNDL